LTTSSGIGVLVSFGYTPCTLIPGSSCAMQEMKRVSAALEVL
jgi:hypothetical protein